MKISWLKNSGPGTLVAAAFIGPGTVTLCTLAGVTFGLHLLWVMGLSVVATIVLQEMAARVGIVSQKGLSEVIRMEIKNPLINKLMLFLILSAIVIGNAAYEAGNISGGILGLEAIIGEISITVGSYSFHTLSLFVGVLVWILLYVGTYRVLEKVFVLLVLVMSGSFLITAFLSRPNGIAILKGMLLPSFPEGSLLTILGLIGTTVVPYNLFLHASLVKEKWHSEKALGTARKDTFISIALGGLVSVAIIICAASTGLNSIANASDLARSIAPLYGDWATYLLGIGLFAAGVTSAITAPLATAFVVRGCLGWDAGLQSKRFRAVWMVTLLSGTVFSSLEIKPIEIIKFAQVANGILLPVLVGFLLWVVNKKSVLGTFVNSKIQNVMGCFILIIAVFLGLRGLDAVLGFNLL